MRELIPNKKILINLSAIIPTMDRENILYRTLKSFSYQSLQPKEIIIIDASIDFDDTQFLNIANLHSNLIHIKAKEKGGAAQRNQGISIASSPIIGFFDDDILLEKECIQILWNTLHSDEKCGGVNAVITNQTYHPPGKISLAFYRLIGIDTSYSLAGKCIGPAINFLPPLESKQDFLTVDWLNTTCTIYKKEALPFPVFDNHFTGYSLMEDLALSLRVGKKWKLLNANKARIYHDSQPSKGKNDLFINAEMDLVNRFYIMKFILNQFTAKEYFKLFLQQIFAAISSKKLFSIAYLHGKLSGLKKISKL